MSEIKQQNKPKGDWTVRHRKLGIILGSLALMVIMCIVIFITGYTPKEITDQKSRLQSFVNQLNNAGEGLRLYAGKGEKGRYLSLGDRYKMVLLKDYGASFEVVGDNPATCEIIGWVPGVVWNSYEYQWKTAFIKMIFFEIKEFTGSEMHSVTIKDHNSGETLAKMNLFGEKIYR